MRRLLMAVVAIAVASVVWLVGFADDREPSPVVPDTTEQFSLDLDVLTTTDHDLVYVVEQRARPSYRIFSYDPATGEDETVYTVPENALIFGIALNPSGDTMAVAYTPDWGLGGGGIWTLDLASGELSEVSGITEDVYLTDLSWSPDGTKVLATQVDRSGEDELLSAAAISLASGEVSTLADQAVNPVQVDDTVFVLNVDDSSARRSIDAIDADGLRTTLDFGTGEDDLDHLMASDEKVTTNTSLQVAVLEPADEGLTIGDAAGAHGNHDVPSTWWSLGIDSAAASASDLEPIIVYDAINSGGAIVYATQEGLSVEGPDGQRIDLIASRAIRFVAG